ncbi:contractile injection system tape measure protein [Novosphingobium sp. FSW06-99]|uniref:contractile injection system tape measure protein n=1 Tax=Novosphingobium sp. FSW06-99 TaxID=1739113 RepID=UPI001E465A9E|nr:contractile injection system tape measure protein [Novosphingobium sp. FSW06-99]
MPRGRVGAQSHRIGKLDVSVAVADLDRAMALRPQLETLARRVFPQVLERVFDRLGPIDGCLQIATLDLDLGRLRPDFLETDAVAALENALAEALARALHAARAGGDGDREGDVRLVAEGPWHLQQLGEFLERGTLARIHGDDLFNLSSRIKASIMRDGAALAAMLRRLSRRPWAIERLVRQLDDAGLRSVLRLMLRDDRFVIHALIAALLRLHVQTARDEWRVRVWTAVLDPVLAAGSPFDLRRLVDAVLAALADLAGVSPAGLRAMLNESVAAGRSASHAALLAALRRRPDHGAWFDPAMSRDQALQLGEQDFRLLVAHLAGARAPALIAAFERSLARTTPGARAVRMATLRARLLRALPVVGADAADRADDSNQRPLERVGGIAAGSTVIDRTAIAAFLQSGSPAGAGAQLPALVASDPDWLAAEARRGAGSPAAAAAIATRLLGWLLPDEIIAVLGPGKRVDAGKGADFSWWRATIVALLLDSDPPLPPAGRGVGQHFDRLEALAAWLDGRAPLADSASALMAIGPAERISLFSADREDIVLARLQRAAQTLPPAALDSLIAQCAPWAKSDRGVLAPVLAGRSAAERRAIRLRAAASALIGDSVGLDRLGDPLPSPDDPAVAPMPPGGRTMPTMPALLDWLDGATAPAADAGALGALFVSRLDAGDRHLINWLLARRARATDRARWAAILPVPGLGRLLHLLAPAVAATLHDAIMLVTTAARHGAPFGARTPDPRVLWAAAFDAATASVRVDVAIVVARLIRTMAGENSDRAARIRARALRLADTGGHFALVAVLRRPVPPVASARAPRASPLPVPEPADGKPDQSLYVANAGLVLVHPFLPRLFDELGLLGTDAEGRTRVLPGEALSRACHLLQFLVDGRLDRPEPHLVLNKLLCGVPPAMPVARAIDPRSGDLATCDAMLKAVLANWPPLNRTSIDALQETFFQREGRLQCSGGKWTLQVQRKTLDVLMDQIPWGLSVVYHHWMPEPIYVTW